MHICCAWWWTQYELCERTKVQGELESALELASTAAIMKNQFLTNMSHEVGRERVKESFYKTRVMVTKSHCMSERRVKKERYSEKCCS